MSKPSKALTHTLNCPAETPSREHECTCGLMWRIQIQTEQTMHAAWRKRAEEAEAAMEPEREAARKMKEAMMAIMEHPVAFSVGALRLWLDAKSALKAYEETQK